RLRVRKGARKTAAHYRRSGSSGRGRVSPAPDPSSPVRRRLELAELRLEAQQHKLRDFGLDELAQPRLLGLLGQHLLGLETVVAREPQRIGAGQQRAVAEHLVLDAGDKAKLQRLAID